MVTKDRLKCCQRVSGAFLDNGWFRALGTSFSQALLKTQERVKTHTDAFLALKNHGVSVGSVYSNRSLERVPLLL